MNGDIRPPPDTHSWRLQTKILESNVWILADGDCVSNEFAASIFKVTERLVYVEDRGIRFLRDVDI
jgi:hypothetical protein